jgi:hypothetical protein
MSAMRAPITAVSLALVLAAATSVAGASGSDFPIKRSSTAILSLKTGEPFLAVRARILRHGWMPVRMHKNDSYEYDGAEKRLAERGFLEVDSCSLDAGANCVLYYQNATRCLRLETVGEQVNDMKVTRWVIECPSKEQ